MYLLLIPATPTPRLFALKKILLSLNQSASLSVSLSVCLFECSLTPPNGKPQQADILRDDSPWDGKGFRLKNIRIR